MSAPQIEIGQQWRFTGPETSSHFTVGKSYKVLSTTPDSGFYIEDNDGHRSNGGAGHFWKRTAEFLAKFEPEFLPVRTVTRTEIIAGAYGPINVTNVHSDGVNIYANSGKWSASDLRHAARSFVSMAEVLEAGK